MESRLLYITLLTNLTWQHYVKITVIIHNLVYCAIPKSQWDQNLPDYSKWPFVYPQEWYSFTILWGNNCLIHKECEEGSECWEYMISEVESTWLHSLSCSGLKDSVKNAMAAECSVCQTLPNKGKIQQCQTPDDLFGEETILFRHDKQ